MSEKYIEGQVYEFDPAIISADPKKNSRFGLRQAKVKELSERIIAEGQLQPIEITPVTGQNGFQYQVVFGNYRLAAVNLLNEQAAGLNIKAIIKNVEPDSKEMVIRNVSENIDRQDLTPMDTAQAIQNLLDCGVDKMTVRAMFSRPGRRGPVSNSWVNITTSFLDLPTKIQNKIHNGEIDWSGAAMLAKINKDDKDKLPGILDELETARQKAIDKEEREEEKYLATLKKAEDAEAKEQEAELKISRAKEEKANALKAAKDAVAKCDADNLELIAKAKAELDAANKSVSANPSEGAKAVAEAAKHLDNIMKAAEREKAKTTKALKKLEEQYKAEADKAKEEAKAAKEEAKAAKDEAKAAKEDKKAKGSKKGTEKAQSAKDVAQAAAKVSDGKVVLTRKQIMDVVDGMCQPGGAGKSEGRIQELGKMLKSCFNSGITEGQLYKKLLELFK